MMTTTIEWLLLIGLSFLPPLVYTIWIRNTERCHREQWISIALCFLWGATLAILAAIILEGLLQIPLAASIVNENMFYLITVVIIAPIAEEFTKPLALRLRTVKKEIDELEDGLIYGAVAGLGFSATENLFYGYSFLSESLAIFFLLMIMRSFGGCLLHASATAWTGYGYGKALMKHTTLLRVLPYFILAIIVHALYNFLVSFDMIGIFSGLVAAFIFVGVSIIIVRRKIQILDGKTC
jgi:RsiW-degrading membrane proteinase PrsW (M82 family)